MLLVSCSPESTRASECRVANVTITVFDDDQGAAPSSVTDELGVIFEDDQAFDNELEPQVADVRFLQSPEEAALNQLRTGGQSSSARPTVVAVLSVAAGTVVVALWVLKGRNPHKRAGDMSSYDETTSNTI
jgi:hypothetical protein